jgi:hypothetical protein
MVMRMMGAMGMGIKRSWRKLAIGCGIAGLAGVAFCWGRTSAQCQTPSAATATLQKPGEMVREAPLAPESGTDYSRRVVAYIYKNIALTREDLGEYLIARYGVDKVEALINRRVVDMACQARGIQITDAEVNATLGEDLKGFGGITLADFETKLLKPRGTTLYQWREDVIRPKLALTQFCRERVKVTDWDITKAFENRYGPKVQCRMILIPKDARQDRHNYDLWEKVSRDEKAFNEAARTQSIRELAAHGGEVPPICKYCGAEEIEKQAFNLKPGEVSGLIATPDGTIILKCDKRIERNEKVKLDDVKKTLEKEIYDRKIMEEIPKVLKELRAKAEPQIFFKKPMPYDQYMANMAHTAGVGSLAKPQPTAAHGN